MSVMTRAGAEIVSFEEFAGFDSKGKPQYNAPVPVERCRVVETVRVVPQSDGTHERTTLAVWVPAETAYTPTRDDRFVWGPEFRYYVVREVDKPRSLGTGAVHHVRLLCREA